MLRILTDPRSQRGLTLIEIIVVLVLLAIIMSFLASRLFGLKENAQQNLASMKLKDLKSKIDLFQLQYQAIPSSLDDLVKGSDKTGQGFVPLANEDSLKDPWGNKIYYKTEDGKRYMIKSLGQDGREGGDGVDSDITVTGP